MPNLFLDVRGRVERSLGIEKRDAASQGLTFLTGDIAQKIIVSPMRVRSINTDGIILTGRRGVQFLVHSVTIGMRNTAAGAGASGSVRSTFYGVVDQYILFVSIVPNVANTAYGSVTTDCLTDEGADVIAGMGADAGIVTVSYQEVQTNNA